MNRKLVSTVLIALIAIISTSFNVASPALAVDIQTISAAELKKILESKEELVLIDVREKDEFASGHIKGAQNFPLSSLKKDFKAIPKNKKIVIYCRSGNKSKQAASLLIMNGYTGLEEMEGFKYWIEKGFPYVKGEK